MKTKLCSRCGFFKPTFEFNKNSGKRDGLQIYCRDCQNKHSRDLYNGSKVHRDRVKERNRHTRERLRKFVYEYLMVHPCVDCGEPDPVVLEFDHTNSKDMEVSVMVKSRYSIERVAAEIDKCEVRCANCHKRKHAKENGSYTYKYSLPISSTG